jgi:hypothetical protein
LMARKAHGSCANTVPPCCTVATRGCSRTHGR